jgi:hypothetical protein
MAQPSRTAQIAKIHKILKKCYKPINPEPSRSVIDHLLFACCLENAPYDATEEAFAALSHNFFDWNEVRVSTVRELAEEMPRLPDATAAAQRIKRVLQSIFDATYTFDLEDFRKLNLGPATEKLGKFEGTTPFSVAYVVQAALGGHAIPIDQGVIKALELADMITPEEVQSGRINGLERAITKPKGCEFASLLHQLGADFLANPQSPTVVQILVDLNPAVAERMSKRRPKKADHAEPQPAAQGDVPPCPPQTAEGEPEVKKKRSETRKKAIEKPASPGPHEPKQAEAEAHQPKPAEAIAAGAKPQEPKQAEAKPAEVKRAEAKRAVGQAAAAKPAPAKAHAPKSSGKQEQPPAAEEGKEPKEKEPVESPPVKRKPAASRKETQAKKAVPASQSKEHPEGEEEKKKEEKKTAAAS